MYKYEGRFNIESGRNRLETAYSRDAKIKEMPAILKQVIDNKHSN